MADPTHNLQHLKEGLARMLYQFQGKPNFVAILSSYLVQIQEIEDMFYDLLIKRRLANAEGAQLDGIGSIVRENRRGRDDENYRTAIRARIRILKLNSRIEDVILVVTLAVPGATVRVIELGIASFEVHADGVPLDVGETVARSVFEAKGGGIGMRFYWHPDSATAFEYSPTGSLIPSSPQGYNNGTYAGVSTGEI